MDTKKAFAMGQATRGNPRMVFDWKKAAELIRDRKPTEVSAGLQDDWGWTGGEIFKDGKPVPKDDTYTFLGSTWATPEIDIDGEVIDCFVMASETDGWGSKTYWPQEALDILNGEGGDS